MPLADIAIAPAVLPLHSSCVVGESVGRYELVSRLAAVNTGEIFLARDQNEPGFAKRCNGSGLRQGVEVSH